MARSISKSFYKSDKWIATRRLYLLQVGGLCENCLAKGIYKPAEHIHHIIHLSPENVNNCDIAYGFDNLKALCIECHNEEHFKKEQKRYSFGPNGEILPHVDFEK